MSLTGNIMRGLLAAAILMLSALCAVAQSGTIRGVVVDLDSREGLLGAKVIVEGTNKGAQVNDVNGKFTITGLQPGDYSVRVTLESYKDIVYTGIHVTNEEPAELTVEMVGAGVSLDEQIIVGEADLIDPNTGRSGGTVGKEDLEQMNVRVIEDVVGMRAGVNVSPDGLQVRGGRTYETKYMVEGVDARDPLAGTGFGVSVGASSAQEVDIITGGGDAELGGGTSGVVNTKIREGGKTLDVNGSWYRDNFVFNPHGAMSWNTDFVDIAAGGPVPGTKGRLSFFASGGARLTDTYFGTYANQLHSSMLPSNDSLWAPRQDNGWTSTAKLTLTLPGGKKLSISNQHSLNINQNSRTLQIVGNDAIMTPGFPYPYSLNLDNATTYTHQSNLTVLNFKSLLDSTGKWFMDITAGRLFTNLRADANGRPLRDSTVDMLYDPASIVTNPVSVFNPGDSVVYVYPGPGLYNNGGIGTLWHDHYASEYTFKYKFIRNTKNRVHTFSFGQEHKEQEYQWVDVNRPWVGAPIVIDDTTTTPSTSLGSSSDVWKAKPATGGFFVQDEIKYKGLIAFLGFRFDYWAPGKFVDDAVANPEAPVVDAVREQYLQQSTAILGRRFKARLLPKLRVSFPVTDNDVLYFNYGHATQLPHPRFVYAGLDPVYQDRSFLANLGNPNLNPEVTVSYEVGLKSKINKNLALTISAFYNDKFDYIVSRRILIEDNTGRLVEKTFFINQDYARIRGIEVELIRRLGKTFKVQFSGGYQIATGKSNTAAESALQIKTQGFVNANQEQYLAWDRPFDFKMALFWKADTSSRIGRIRLNGFRFFLSATFKSGLRYTPYIFSGRYTDTGRPIYEQDVENPFSKVGAPWFWTDARLSRDFRFGKNKSSSASLSFEVKNIFNNKNSQIINGVTGKAYRDGDPLPIEYRDPTYPDPQDNGIPPFNPARYLQQRQMLLGLTFNL